MARILSRLAFSGVCLLMGCGDGVQPNEPAGPEIPGEFVIVAGDPGEFDFDLPVSVPAGRYQFVLTNEGEQPHHAQVYRLRDGVSFVEFQDALLSNVDATRLGLPDEARRLVAVPPTGVLSSVAPGGEGTARGQLEPGAYAAVCFLLDIGETVTPHYALGMVAEIEVTSG